MTILPVVARELLVASRRSGTYWMRLSAAGLALGFGCLAFFTFTLGTPTGVVGGRMFLLLGWAGLVFALLVGTGATADSISKENREGTLGLLFLTDLKGLDVVLGKMAASSLTVVYGLVAMLPVLALTLLIGGVSFGEYFRVALAWLNGLFLALSLGLMVSASSRDERIAFGNAFATLMVVTVLMPLLGFSLLNRFGPHEWFYIFHLVSPLTTLHFAFDANLRSLGPAFPVSLALTHLLAWLALGVACRVTKRAWHDAVPATRPRRWPWPWSKSGRFPEGGAFPTRHIQGRTNLMINPIFWLLTRERRLRTYPWILLAAMTVIWGWAFWRARAVFSLEVSIALGFLTHFLFKYWIATQAAHSFSRDRAGAALELILCTPIGVRPILNGVAIAMRYLFAGPVTLLLVAELVLVILSLGRALRHELVLEQVGMILCGLVLMVVDAWALIWVGVLAGLGARRAQSAVYRTLFLILGLPWVGVWALGLCLDLNSGTAYGWFVLWAWLGFSLVVDFFFGLRARARLHRHFREIAIAGPAMRREPGTG